jgi:hypothetical protein
MNHPYTDYKGIDYSLGIDSTNRDPETGIRFGVISQNDVDWWHESSEAIYPECEEPECKEAECCECDFEPIGFKFEGDDYKAFGDEVGDIFVEKSKFFTFAQFCSPCAPGACHLNLPLLMTNGDVAHANTKADISNPSEFLNNKCYCFGHDMFADDAPYPVYSIETGKLVKS